MRQAAEYLRRHRTDVLLAVAAFVTALVAVWLASGLLDRRLLDYRAMDVWFEADTPRVFDNMVSRWSNNYRSGVHPLFSLMVFPFVQVLQRGLHLEAWTAVRVVLACGAGLWLATIFAVLRIIGCRRPDALVFSLLGATSAGAMFWSAIPETHPLGSFTVVLALLLIAVSAHRAVPESLDVAASAATLAVTVTNWMFGLAAVLVRRPWRRTVQISANALVVVVLLWVVEKHFMPSSLFFLGNPSESDQIFAPESRGPVAVAASFFGHTMVMPAITVVDRPSSGAWPIMVTQPSAPGSAGPWGAAALGLWVTLLLMGAWALWTVAGQRPLRIFLALVLTGQFALYVAFGTETFLYAPMLVPLFVMVVAFTSFTRLRVAALGVAAAFVVTSAVNNGAQWRRAAGFLGEFSRLEHDVTTARRERPAGPWPDVPNRASMIELAGSRSFLNGYANQAGTFNPGLDQFAIAFWQLGPDGSLRASSDMAASWPGTGRRPLLGDSTATAISVATDAYRATWSAAGPGRWQLDLDVPEGVRLALTVRSVGLRSGPIRLLEWDGRRLRVNGRWLITTDSGRVAAYLLDESTTPDWVRARPTVSRAVIESGWAAARLELAAPGRYRLVVEDLEPAAPIDRTLTTLPSSSGQLGARVSTP